jgi:hypothetical protein
MRISFHTDTAPEHDEANTFAGCKNTVPPSAEISVLPVRTAAYRAAGNANVLPQEGDLGSRG